MNILIINFSKRGTEVTRAWYRSNKKRKKRGTEVTRAWYRSNKFCKNRHFST